MWRDFITIFAIELVLLDVLREARAGADTWSDWISRMARLALLAILVALLLQGGG